MVKNYTKLRKQATRLRKKGYSYGEIRSKIGVSKSTLSYWLRYIPLTEDQKKRFYNKSIWILSLGSQSQKERRKREIDKILELARQEVKLPLDKDALKLMGAALYWGEGSKKGRFQITNSDPSMILFTVKWISTIFDITPRELKASLNIYPQQNEKHILGFWSELTKIPTNNFGKTFVKPLSKGYKKNNLYYGTIKITIPKSTDLKHRVEGWISAVLSDVEHEARNIEFKWSKLQQIQRPVNLC